MADSVGLLPRHCHSGLLLALGEVFHDLLEPGSLVRFPSFSSTATILNVTRESLLTPSPSSSPSSFPSPSLTRELFHSCVCVCVCVCDRLLKHAVARILGWYEGSSITKQEILIDPFDLCKTTPPGRGVGSNVT